MSGKANPLRIGLFIFGGLAIAILAVMMFGSGVLFEERRNYVAYFEGPLEGLSVGSPVTFRGVKIGEVTAIELEMDVRTYSARIPVYYFVDRNKVRFLGGNSQDVSVAELIHRGLRAEVIIQSLITGQQAIELDMRPDVPIIFVAKGHSPVPEVPVMPSELETVKKRLTSLPIEQLAQETLKMVTDVDHVVGSADTQTLLRALAGTAQQWQQLTHDDVGPSLQDLQKLLQESTATMVTLRTTLDSARAEFADTAHDVRVTAAAATQQLQNNGPALRALLEHSDQAMAQMRGDLDSLSSVIGPDRPGRADLDELLREWTLTSRALHDLADELRRNPNLLLTGKKSLAS